jgi:hypothetical protein
MKQTPTKYFIYKDNGTGFDITSHQSQKGLWYEKY